MNFFGVADAVVRTRSPAPSTSICRASRSATTRTASAVFLRDIWPTNEQIKEAVRAAVKPEQYKREYGKVFDGDESWKRLMVPEGQDVSRGTTSRPT